MSFLQCERTRRREITRASPQGVTAGVFGFFTAFGFIAVAVMPAESGGGLSKNDNISSPI